MKVKTVGYPKHTQIIFFKSGHKKTIANVVKVTESEMVRLTCENGVEFMINKQEVEMVERFIPDEIQTKATVSSADRYRVLEK